jgi:dTDP-glucose 4,6-dehydratase
MNLQRSPNRILVTGGAGFIGSSFIRYLLTKVRDFKGLCLNYDVLTYAGNLQNLREIDRDPRYIFHKGDIRDEAVVEDLCRKYEIDTIVHFAAESHVDRSILGPQAFIETNVVGTFNLLEVVRRLPHIHFHHISTDEVYGCLGDSGYFTEESPYRPNSPYSASKAGSDHLVRAYGKTYGLSTTISNCSNNYGPYQFPEKLIPVMILSCLSHKPLPIYGEGKNVRDWLYVDDHASAVWKILTQGVNGETYNVGGESEWRNIDLVYELIKIFAKLKQVDRAELESLIEYVKDRPGHDYRYAIDCTKIKQELGWKPEHSFEQGMEATVKWYLDHPEWIKGVQNGSYRKWMTENYAGR